MKKFLIIANWKMNPATQKEAKALFDSAKKAASRAKKSEVVICPPFPYIAQLLPSSKCVLGAQDCSWQEKGALTGEVSASMVRDLKCQYIILGHSERRKKLGETAEQINVKIKIAIKNSLTPIFCVGETLKEREAEKTKELLEEQVFKGLDGVSKNLFVKKNVILAYEPIWAISTSTEKRTCAPEEAHTMGLLLRKIISQKYSRGIAAKLRIIYGGSVDSGNILGFAQEAAMDGVLVGGASLDAREFAKIIKIVG